MNQVGAFSFTGEETNPDGGGGLLDKNGTYAVDCTSLKLTQDGQIEMNFKVVAALSNDCRDQIGRTFKQWITDPNDVPEKRQVASRNVIVRLWIAFGNYTEKKWKEDRESGAPIQPNLGQCLGKRGILTMKMTHDEDDKDKVKYRNISRSTRIDDPEYAKFAASFANVPLTPVDEDESEAGGDDDDWG